MSFRKEIKWSWFGVSESTATFPSVVSVEMQLGKCGKFDPRKCWAGDEATETWNCLCGKSQSQTSTTTAPRATCTGFWALLGTPPPWQPLPGLGNPFRGFFFSIISNINLPWHNLRSLWKAQVFPGRCWALAGLWRGQEWFMNWRDFQIRAQIASAGRKSLLWVWCGNIHPWQLCSEQELRPPPHTARKILSQWPNILQVSLQTWNLLFISWHQRETPKQQHPELPSTLHILLQLCLFTSLRPEELFWFDFQVHDTQTSEFLQGFVTAQGDREVQKPPQWVKQTPKLLHF